MHDETGLRAASLLDEQRRSVLGRTDRLFAGLLVFQWLGGIAAALWVSPRSWAGSTSQPHIHLWVAVFLGGAVISLPILFALLRPGAALTRHTIAIGEMLMAALLIHLTGGRIETHFLIFGSLAFLSFYRDWRVLITATVVTAVDHFARGIFWPQSIFGVLTASPWRPVEHAAWVVFEDIFLIIACVQGTREMASIARRQARVEATNADLQSLVTRVQGSSVALMSTATEIAATSRQQEGIVSEHVSSTNQVAVAAREIAATSQELLRTVNEVNEVAARTAAMAAEGKDNLAGMDKTMHLLADATGSIGAKLSVISDRTANINLVVTTITKVAEQTNLLSINAAIEAEKAGEYGLGFLVVAREIRRLADQTSVATLEIDRMVKDMQSSVMAGVMEMDKFRDRVSHGVVEVSQVGERLGQIIGAVRGLTERFEQVTEGMRVQTLGADQIREAVVRLGEGAHQTSTSLREFNRATDHLRDAVGELKEEVSRVQLETPAFGQPLQAA
jgi:methyl-accepting chemotaxis protein